LYSVITAGTSHFTKQNQFAMYRILVVEDNPVMLKTVEIKLERDGYEVISCSDGRLALEKLNTELPDLILTDIMLPSISGLEIVSAVRSITSKYIPIIVFSGMGQEETVEEAFSLGADDYITKPFSLTELSIRIQRLLKRISVQSSN
jgi:DNA-binding response OmpR family regulator